MVSPNLRWRMERASEGKRRSPRRAIRRGRSGGRAGRDPQGRLGPSPTRSRRHAHGGRRVVDGRPPLRPRRLEHRADRTRKSAWRPRLFSALLQELGDQAGPAGLVAGADSGAVVAVEIFVKEQVIAELRVFLHFRRGAEGGLQTTQEGSSADVRGDPRIGPAGFRVFPSAARGTEEPASASEGRAQDAHRRAQADAGSAGAFGAAGRRGGDRRASPAQGTRRSRIGLRAVFAGGERRLCGALRRERAAEARQAARRAEGLHARRASRRRSGVPRSGREG